MRNRNAIELAAAARFADGAYDLSPGKPLFRAVTVGDYPYLSAVATNQILVAVLPAGPFAETSAVKQRIPGQIYH